MSSKLAAPAPSVIAGEEAAMLGVPRARGSWHGRAERARRRRVGVVGGRQAGAKPAKHRALCIA
jgi:hypothetical protein